MNENKKLLVIGGVIGVVLLLLVMSLIKDGSKQGKVIEEFNEAFIGEESELVFIGRPTCGYCNYMKPILDNMAEEYDFDYIYINSDEMSSSNFNKVLSKLNVDTSNFGTPYTAIVKNGEVVATQPGYTTEEFLFEVLQEGGIISSDATLKLNYISYDDFTNIVAAGTKSLVVLSQATSDEAVAMLEGLKDVTDETGYKFNVLNLSFMSEEQAAAMASLLPYYNGSSDNIAAPVSIIVENGDIVDAHVYTTVEEYTEFLTTNGFIG